MNATNTASTITCTAPLIDTCEAKIKVELIETDSTKKSPQSVNPFYIYTTILFNRGPIACAGPDQEVSEGVLVRLDGSGSRDPDGDPLIYKWRQIEPPDPIVRLMNNWTARPSFITSVIDYAVDFMLELEVWDGRERTGTVLTAPTPSEPDPDRFYNLTLTPNVPQAPGHITLKSRAGEATHPDLIEVNPIPEFYYEWASRSIILPRAGPSPPLPRRPWSPRLSRRPRFPLSNSSTPDSEDPRSPSPRFALRGKYREGGGVFEDLRRKSERARPESGRNEGELGSPRRGRPEV
ncbi:MAG: PKD domain-containing protein, partial [Thermoplasmatota archaeon]